MPLKNAMRWERRKAQELTSVSLYSQSLTHGPHLFGMEIKSVDN